MEISILLIFVQFIVVLAFSPCPFAAALDTLAEGSSLSVEQPADTLVSANRIFSTGFFKVGDNAFCFSIWFATTNKPTVVWMANRDRPVNGKASKLSLLKNGTLVLIDAGLLSIWTAMTSYESPAELKLMNNGNLVLQNLKGLILWQSFDTPTDTLLPGQFLTEKSSLISSRSRTNYSSGYYKFYFDTDNLLKLVYLGPNVSSIYWPSPWLMSWTSRFLYNISKTAVLDSTGHFVSSDSFTFNASDSGTQLYRRLVIDSDGQLRLYSFNAEHKTWEVSWYAVAQSCQVHGVCGPNSVCTHDRKGRTCYCPQGYKVKNPHDLSQGCEAEFNFTCNKEEFSFLKLSNMEFYGYDIAPYHVQNLTKCEEICLNLCNDCIGFQFKSDAGGFACFPKLMFLNGHDPPNFAGDIYLKLPKSKIFFHYNVSKHRQVDCSDNISTLQLNIAYEKPRQNATLQFLLWFACSIGGLEVVCIFLVWFFLYRGSSHANFEGHPSATGFQSFTYGELKRATRGFKEEIGRGATGAVYKGRLYDGRIAAIKYLNQANHGQDNAEFIAEISTIRRLNHMNVIEMWGYCAEGKHRLLVYEYMDNGSLTKNLTSNNLDSNKRFSIAVGVAKGLAYLHEECLEWILHCDVKPENILLDSSYEPKVADFGLSKLLNRDGQGSTKFSRMRGTRGYMAPEWIYNLRITSKVDVYSYGMLVLEMVTGRSPAGSNSSNREGNVEQGRFVKLVRERIGEDDIEACVADLIDPKMENQYDIAQAELLLRMSLQCLEEDADARPSMRQVVEMLLSLGADQ